MIESSVCTEKHKRVDERLADHDRQLKNHDKRIGDLEKYQSKAEEQVSQLCRQIKSLVTAIWWAIGLAISTLLGFFIWYIQTIGR